MRLADLYFMKSSGWLQDMNHKLRFNFDLRLNCQLFTFRNSIVIKIVQYNSSFASGVHNHMIMTLFCHERIGQNVLYHYDIYTGSKRDRKKSELASTIINNVLNNIEVIKIFKKVRALRRYTYTVRGSKQR